MGLRLHPQYGLNPTLGKCIICGGDTNELGLLGYNQNKEAPMYSILSFEPCATCKEKYLKEGVLLVEGDYEGKEFKPTGHIAVITDEAFARIFNIPIPHRKVGLAQTGVFDKIGIK